MPPSKGPRHLPVFPPRNRRHACSTVSCTTNNSVRPPGPNSQSSSHSPAPVSTPSTPGRSYIQPLQRHPSQHPRSRVHAPALVAERPRAADGSEPCATSHTCRPCATITQRRPAQQQRQKTFVSPPAHGLASGRWTAGEMYKGGQVQWSCIQCCSALLHCYTLPSCSRNIIHHLSLSPSTAEAIHSTAVS